MDSSLESQVELTDMQMLDKFKIFIIPSIRKDVKVTYITEKIKRLGGTILNSHQSLSTMEQCDDRNSVIFLIDTNEPLAENIEEVSKYQKFAEMKKYLVYSKQEISDFVTRIESKIKPKQVSSRDLAKVVHDSHSFKPCFIKTSSHMKKTNAIEIANLDRRSQKFLQ